MITTRQSTATTRNAKVSDQREWAGNNTAWLAQLPRGVVQPGAVLLLGGSSVADFRIRVAQSHLRQDLMPSFWSQVGIVVSADEFLSVPVSAPVATMDVAPNNAVCTCPIRDYADPRRFPNIAVLHFADRGAAIVDYARRVMRQRSAADLPLLLHAWLGFVWGVGTSPNPLMQSTGLPSSALVETAFGMAGIELTPGVASASSCPEAIWQSAIWWHDYYEKAGGALARATAKPPKGKERLPVSIVPRGASLTRQRAAAVIDPGDAGA